MSNEESRRTEAEEAKRFLHQRQKEQYEELDQALELLASKGYILDSELESLLKKGTFKSFKEEDVKARIKVKIKKDTQADKEKDSVQPLEASTAKQIAGSLEIAGKTNLYDLLGLQRSSSLATLQDRTAEEYERVRKIAANNSELTATLELLGHCKNIFKVEESRKRYDKTLDQERFKALDKLIDIAGGDGEINANEFEHLVIKGAAMGLDKEEAIHHIKKYSKSKKWGLQLPGKNSSLEQAVPCGVCGTLNQPGSKYCENCSFDLEVNCPRCSTKSASTTRVCPSCGFAIGDMPNAIPLMRTAKEAIADGDYTTAEKYFNLAHNYWENHPDITVGRKRLKELSGQVDTAFQQVKSLMLKEEYYKARDGLVRLKAMQGGDQRAALVESKISDKIKQTEGWLEKAKTAADNTSREDAYLQALHICRDCKEAVEGLARIAPEAPNGLTVTVQNEAVLLKWGAVASRSSILFRIVRKEGGLPIHPDDGANLAETAQLSFTDVEGRSGQTYYYAVFSKRGEKFSGKAAVSQPVTIIAEVKGLETLSSDGMVTLSWRPPSNVRRIEVWTKKDAVPSRRGDGVLLTGVRNDGATHTDLANGDMNGYLVVPIFQDAFGKELPGRGTGAYASATKPPKPIDELEVAKNGNRIEAQWEVGADVVELFSSMKPFSQKFGEVFSYSSPEEIGTAIPVHQKGKATARISKHGVTYLLPITVKGGIAVAGRSATILHFEEVTQFSVRVEDGNLQLKWGFPLGVEKVIVTCADKFNPDNETRYEVLEKEYRKLGYFPIGQLPDYFSEVIVKVRTLIEEPGLSVHHSEGVTAEVKLKKTIIYFEVAKAGFISFFSKGLKFDLQIKAEGNLSTPMELVVKENNKLTSFKDPARRPIMDLDMVMFEENGKLNTTFQYQPTSKAVKNLFFSIIPKNPEDKEDIQVNRNGKKVAL
ncbi:MAG: hypothetical protein KDD01_24795 [Phaeodactylibacter sp.]|nr:hypothetical protein [Phaeodactylibacter sp.]